jgi:hypothetical protein
MKIKLLTASLLAALLSTTVLADTSSIQGSSHGLLENQWVKAGINKDAGTFGSGGGTSPGLLFDPTGTGTFNAAFDYLTPGAPFDGQAIKIDGTNYVNNNTGDAAIVDPDGLVNGTNNLTWLGSFVHGGATWTIENTFTLPDNQPYVDVTVTITAGSAATSLSYGKYIDPDSQGMAGDSSSTDNVLGYGSIPVNNVVFSEATVSRYALGLYTTDSNTTTGIQSWTQQADGYSGTVYGANYGNGDDTIGISWTWSNISVGDILTASYAYIFGPSAFDAASDAVAGGAGGGADVTGGAGVTDIGSATDAASGSGTTPTPTPTPTVVSTTTATISSTSEAPSTTLPVLTSSITHHDSSIVSGVQTIDRETTTTVTTPVDVTTTSFVRTTDTYSDSSVVVTNGAATSTVVVRNDVEVTVTDPGSFVARMDQADALQSLDIAHTLPIANGVRAGKIDHSMANGYSAESTVYGAGVNITTQEELVFGAGINFVSTSMTGETSVGSMDTTHLALSVGKKLDQRDLIITGQVGTAKTELAYHRTIGDFEAAGATSGSDTWATLTVGKAAGTVRPWAGYTLGNKTTDGYTETGDIQAIIAHNDQATTYNYATIGVDVVAGPATIGLSKAFDAADTLSIGVGVNHSINDRVSIVGSFNKTVAGDNDSMVIAAGLQVTF